MASSATFMDMYWTCPCGYHNLKEDGSYECAHCKERTHPGEKSDCIRCKGMGVDIQGIHCELCEGTGYTLCRICREPLHSRGGYFTDGVFDNEHSTSGKLKHIHKTCRSEVYKEKGYYKLGD